MGIECHIGECLEEDAALDRDEVEAAENDQEWRQRAQREQRGVQGVQADQPVAVGLEQLATAHGQPNQ